MNQPNHISIFKESKGVVLSKVRFIPIRENSPVIVGIFVVVTGDLLLLRSFREELYVRVEETTAVSRVFDGHFWAECDFEGRVGEIGTSEIGLEERRHLSVSRAGIFEDQKMDPEWEHVDEQGEENEGENTSCPVTSVFNLLWIVFTNGEIL
jgi:hypothetical protein